MWFVLFTIFVITLLLTKVKKSQTYNWDVFMKIPGPKQYPLIGNLLDFLKGSREENFLKERKHARDFYPIYKLSAFNIGTVNLMGPYDMETILTSMKHISKNDVYTFLHQWLGTGLLTSTDAKWQSRRKILTPAFHFNILQDFFNIFNEETKNLVKRLSEECDRPFIDVKVPITEFTLYSIAETAMGINLNNTSADSKQSTYKNAVFEIGEIIIYRLTRPWMFNNFIYSLSKVSKQEKKTVEVLHDFTNSVIKNRKETFQTKNVEGSYSMKKKLAMLDLLLTYQSQGADISDEGVREEVDTFMFEGHDTTSLALSFILMVLANETKHQEEIYQEIMDTIGNEAPNFNNINDLKYMELCIKECLRLYPSVPIIGRIAGEEFTTHSGYVIPKGTDLILHIYDMHHNPNVFENPEQFDPDRFLPENVKERHPFAYIPFSAGPRNCIGQKFAMLELKTALCGILQNFKMEAVDTPKDMDFFQDLVLRTNNPIRVKFIKRNN